MKKQAVAGRVQPRPVSKQTLEMLAPSLTGASVLNSDHPYHSQFVKWLKEREEAMGEEAARPNKRKGRLFLASRPSLKQNWPSIWAAKERFRQRNQRKAA